MKKSIGEAVGREPVGCDENHVRSYAKLAEPMDGCDETIRQMQAAEISRPSDGPAARHMAITCYHSRKPANLLALNATLSP